MLRCRTCGQENPESGRYCMACGEAVRAAGPEPTCPYEPRPSAAAPSAAAPARGRFTAGAVLAGRYRIVASLGRGGMGDVYRADDLQLGQPVALKFLPDKWAGDPERREYLRNEVRLARQVAHPHVCRVYDIGEAEGRPFITMEFIDGEDLATLLKRIGRLPPDKALEIARQLCLGLAAAHDRGVLHRDLKPGNVMLDGRGQVRVTDFGLARLLDQAEEAHLRVGTPAYMAPEQLAGEQASLRSDVYALGLVLYEVFTGKRAFPARSARDAARLAEDSTPTNPSSHVSDLDPMVERVILRCLEKDPRDRPGTALAVLASLPGGDPLAEALAAGYTPSPEMVAGSGGRGGLSLPAAIGCLVTVLVGLLFYTSVRGWFGIEARSGLTVKPEVLEAEAQRMLDGLGYGCDQDACDSVYGFRFGSGERSFKQSDERLEFWYRRSRAPLVPLEQSWYRGPHAYWGVTLTNPPPWQEGMIGVRLDPKGKLIELFVMAKPAEAADGPSKAADWAPLFALAGLDFQRFRDHPAAVLARPLQFADEWRAWAVSEDETTVRVDAAGCGGRPVFFLVSSGSDPQPAAAEASRSIAAAGLLGGDLTSPGESGLALRLLVIHTVVPLAGALLAWRNCRLGRSDRKRAVRCAMFAVTLGLLLWLFETRHTGNVALELHLFCSQLGRIIAACVMAWIWYLAMEPYVRRFWPDAIIAWVRAFSGRLSDPLVGRDVLIGVTAAAVYLMIRAAVFSVDAFHAGSVRISYLTVPDTLLGGRHVAARLVHAVYFAFNDTLFYVMLLLLLRLLLRNRWLAAAGCVAILTLIARIGVGAPVLWLIAVVFFAFGTAVLTRFGLVAFGVFTFSFLLFARVPLTADLTAWYAGPGLVATGVVLALAVYGAVASLGGWPFGPEKSPN